MVTKVVPLCMLIGLVLAADIGKTAARVCQAYLDLLQKINELPGGTPCGWIPVDESRQRPAACDSIISAGIEHDELGRRASGRLARPESQGDCGSCWAFASSHTFSDRLRLADNRYRDLVVSAEDVTTCIQESYPELIGPESDGTEAPDRIPNGCCGGSLNAGFQYFIGEGAVSSECKPYSKIFEDYSKDETPRLTCTDVCYDQMPVNRDLRLHSYRKVQTESEVIAELESGPVIVSMLVPDDLFFYACGIYCYTRLGDIMCGHAVEIVDYGSENGINYWVVKNSWGEDFGENGYFRISRNKTSEWYFLISGLAPIISETTDTADRHDDTELSCAPVAVSISNEFVQDAAEYAVTMVAMDPTIMCFDGTNTGSGTVESVMAATTQVVAGTLFSLTIDAAISGCNEEGIITADVLLNLNGTLELIPGYQYKPDSGGCNHANTGLVLLIALCMLAFIYI